ncbi:MAG TPA: anaerobic nitric oxide reductase flavorubredoxin [Selenomonadales bacterium]|nr:anaerobic nitric oxide reductase flavorubredoxin [Selenomonadales bacterium]
MSFEIKDTITWVGKIDWELRHFHGEEYSTRRGSSYNAYLVRDEKTVLIDTVWAPFAKEFVAKLKEEIDLNKIDYIVALHGEVDHSGALPELMREIPNTPIYCTANAVKSIKGQYHQDWDFRPVKTGDRLSLGARELIFIEAAMLHWPDNMMAYLTGDSILFSNDAFGQHFASERPFNDAVDQSELYQEATKYYANILNPFSKLVDKKIKEILGLNLPLTMICPSHGIIWRDNPLQIVEAYTKWAADYQENQITIIYDTMWNGTRRMAEAIADGIRQQDGTVTVKLYNSARSDKTEIIAEVFKSKGILVGSPTVNRGVLSSTAGIMEEIKGLSFKNKKAAAFGAYGWSGESAKVIAGMLRESGFAVMDDGLRELWSPDEQALDACVRYGREFAEKL